MNFADQYSQIETIEIPPSVLWKRTLLLAGISVGIGLGVGYLMGRGVTPQEASVLSLRNLASQFKFDSPADKAKESPVQIKQSWQSQRSVPHKMGKGRPTFITLDDEATPATGKG